MAALQQFVAALGIKQPFALVVQVGGWVGGWVDVDGWVGGWLGGWVAGWVAQEGCVPPREARLTAAASCILPADVLAAWRAAGDGA